MSLMVDQIAQKFGIDIRKPSVNIVFKIMSFLLILADFLL